MNENKTPERDQSGSRCDGQALQGREEKHDEGGKDGGEKKGVGDKKKYAGKVYLRLIGLRFGRLVVTSLCTFENRQGAHAECLCDCGGIITTSVYSILRSYSRSCGCLRSETTGNCSRTHGRTGSKEYSAWQNMHQRCFDNRRSDWKHYGGRGIHICDSWKHFAQFFKDMGEAPKGMTLDRINNDGNYEPGNCRWATWKTQILNRSNSPRLKWKGNLITIEEAALIAGINAGTMAWRIRKGWNERSITQSVKKRIMKARTLSKS